MRTVTTFIAIIAAVVTLAALDLKIGPETQASLGPVALGVLVMTAFLDWFAIWRQKQ